MDSYEGPLIVAALEQQARCGADAIQIAAAVAAMWSHVEQALTPVIGMQGVAALYQRSLVLTGREHIWLSELGQGLPLGIYLAALKEALSVRDSTEAAHAGGELLQTFYALVAGLIGQSLTRRLLRSLWQAS